MTGSASRQPDTAEPRMARASDTMVVLGDVIGAYGVRGWIKVRPYTQAPENLLSFGAWWLRTTASKDWQKLEKHDGRMHGTALVVALEGIGTREEAAALKGAEIAVPRGALPAAAQGEIYLGDLVGLAVVNRAGEYLGRVTGLAEHGAHPLLRVSPLVREGEHAADTRTTTQERLIPYVPSIVDRVDFEAARIEVDWGADY